MQTTSIFSKNLDSFNQDYRITINQGSSRSSKTISILQLLYLITHYSKQPKVISVVSQTIPHLKKGVIRDMKRIICPSLGISFDKHFNKSELIFNNNESIIEFFSADNTDKVHGSSRDILFVNECNFIPYEIFEHLEIRTSENIFLDYNPITKFWAHTEIIDKGIEHNFIHSTYRDNQFLPIRIKQAIESKRSNENWWRIYGEGELGFSEQILFNEGKLKRFTEITGEDFIGTFSYTDIAYGGGDYFCSIFADVYDRKVFIKDVIFNKHTADINEKLLIQKLKQHKVSVYGIETNAGGAYFGDKIYYAYKNRYISIKSRQNKITRIITEASDIIDNFYFSYPEPGSDYYYYFNNLTSFNTDEKNKHDDAPDTTAGLCNILRNDYRMFG